MFFLAYFCIIHKNTPMRDCFFPVTRDPSRWRRSIRTPIHRRMEILVAYNAPRDTRTILMKGREGPELLSGLSLAPQKSVVKTFGQTFGAVRQRYLRLSGREEYFSCINIVFFYLPPHTFMWGLESRASSLLHIRHPMFLAHFCVLTYLCIVNCANKLRF